MLMGLAEASVAFDGDSQSFRTQAAKYTEMRGLQDSHREHHERTQTAQQHLWLPVLHQDTLPQEQFVQLRHALQHTWRQSEQAAATLNDQIEQLQTELAESNIKSGPCMKSLESTLQENSLRSAHFNNLQNLRPGKSRLACRSSLYFSPPFLSSSSTFIILYLFLHDFPLSLGTILNIAPHLASFKKPDVGLCLKALQTGSGWLVGFLGNGISLSSFDSSTHFFFLFLEKLTSVI